MSSFPAWSPRFPRPELGRDVYTRPKSVAEQKASEELRQQISPTAAKSPRGEEFSVANARYSLQAQIRNLLDANPRLPGLARDAGLPLQIEAQVPGETQNQAIERMQAHVTVLNRLAQPGAMVGTRGYSDASRFER